MAVTNLFTDTGLVDIPKPVSKSGGVTNLFSGYTPSAPTPVSPTPIKPIATEKPLIAKAKNVWNSISSAVGTAYDMFVKKPTISPIPPEEKKVQPMTPLQETTNKVLSFLSTSLLPTSEARIQKEKDWLVKNYDSPITKGLTLIQQMAEADFKSRPETFGFTKGITQLAIGGTKSFNDYYSQPQFIPDNPLGKARMAYGQVAEGFMELYLGGNQLRAINGVKQLLPVMFAAIGQLKASDKATIQQRLLMLPKDVLTGWLFTKIPMSDKVLSTKTGVGALATGTINYASEVTSKLIEGLDAQTALKTSYASFIIGSLFHVAGVGYQQFTGAKYFEGKQTFTPDQVMDGATQMTNKEAANGLMKLAVQAKMQGKNVEIQLNTAKESPAAKIVGKGVVEQVTGQPQEIKFKNGEGASVVINATMVDKASEVGSGTSPVEVKLQKAISTYVSDEGVYKKPDGSIVTTPALKELTALAETLEIQKLVSIQRQQAIDNGVITPDQNGNIVVYRVGSIPKEDRLVSVSLDLAAAQQFSKQASVTGKERPIQEVTINPDQIKVFIGGTENEVLIRTTPLPSSTGEVTPPLASEQPIKPIAEEGGGVRKNIIDFNKGDYIQSVYTKDTYEIIELDERGGLAKLKNLDTGKIEDWNNRNNPHFIQASKPQVQTVGKEKTTPSEVITEPSTKEVSQKTPSEEAKPVTLAPSKAKTPDEQVAEALSIGLPETLKNVFHGESGQRGTGYRKPTMTKSDIKTLLDNMSEFGKNPILTVDENKHLTFKGKTSQFDITPEALQINPNKLKIGQKIKVDIAAIKKAPGVQQMRVYEGGTAFASIGDYAILKNMTSGEKTPPDMPKYKEVPFPELVRIVKELTGKSPQVTKRMGQALGKAYPGGLDIKLATKIFSDPDVAARVIAHELGHIMDYLPEGTKRTGNLLSRIASLNGYMKHFLSEFPGGLDNTLTAKEKYRLKKEAERLAEIPVTETREVVVAEKLPEPKEILDIWRTNTAGIDNPELLSYIQKLSSELKADIVKAALKSQVPKWVTFKKQIKETITSGVIRNAPEDIKRLYQQLLQEEIIKRRLFSLKVIKQELQGLSAEWRPFDRLRSTEGYVKYRDTPSELYADAISVLYNDPERLRATAPEFYRGFFNYLDQKPEVAEVYAKIQDLINGGTEDVNKARLDDLYKGFEEGAAKRKEIFNTEVEGKSFLFKALTRHVTRFHPAYDKLNQLIKQKKVTLTEKQKVRNVLEEMAMTRNDIWMDLLENEEQVMKPLKDVGITEKELGAWFVLERNLNERLGIANPGGLIDHYAQETKDFLEKSFTPVQQEALKAAVKIFHDRTFAIVSEMYNEGMIPEKIWKEKIEPYKDTYVTYGVVKYIEKDYVNPYVKQMTGTLEAIENPLVTTMYKRSSMLQAIAVQKAKVSIRDLLKNYFPDEIEESPNVLGMNLQKIYRISPGKGQMKMLESGKWVAYDVDPYFEAMFKHFDPKDLHTLVELVGKFNRVFKPIVTTYKLGWALWNNPLRDTQRTMRNLAAISKLEGVKFNPIEYLSGWVTTIPEGFKFGAGELSKYAEMAVKGKALSTPFNSHDPTGGEDRALATLYEKYHFLSSGTELSRAAQIRKKFLAPIEIVLKALERIGTTFESTTKIAGFKYLSKKLQDEKQVSFYTRNYIGTPNYVEGGTVKATDNNMMVFSNVIIQGMRTDLELAANPKSRGAYFTQVFLQNTIWKLLMLALAGGFLGKKYKDMYDKIPEYNKTNYLAFPFYEFPDGKVLYVSIPQDDINRLAGAMLWKAGTAMQGELKKPGQLLDVGAGVFPTMTPIFDIISAWFDYARGVNPYDSFYGKNVLTQQVAQIRGMEGLKEMSLWTLNQVGLGNFATYDPSKDTTEEKIIRFSPLINRIFKYSDYGVVEQSQEIQRLDLQQNAIQNKKEADLVDKYAKEFAKNGGNAETYMVKLETALYPLGASTKEEKSNLSRLKKDFTQAVAGRTEDTKYKTVMNLQLNSSKIETLKRYKADMSLREYMDLVDRLYADKMISKAVYQEVQ